MQPKLILASNSPKRKEILGLPIYPIARALVAFGFILAPANLEKLLAEEGNILEALQSNF